MERLNAALCVAQAMEYLHEQRLVFRDLKPDNVAQKGGDYQLFDFGLARELKERDLIEDEDGYKFTGFAGSRRYMAPEMLKRFPYGFKADVYSYGILFWELMALKKPYDDYGVHEHYRRVAQRGERPPSIRHKLASAELDNLMVNSWSASVNQRPSFSAICVILKTELAVNQ